MSRISQFVQKLFSYYRTLDAHTSEVAHGAALAFVLKILGAGLAFGFNLYLARIFGADGVGIYYLALNVVSISTVLGRLGLDNTLLRFTAAKTTSEDWTALKGVYNKGIGIALLAAIVVTVIIYIVTPWFSNDIFAKPNLTTPLRWMALAIIPIALLNLHAEILKGLKHIAKALIVQGIGVPALSIVGLYFIGTTLGIKGAVLVYGLASWIIMLVGFGFWRSATPHLRNISGQFEIKEMLQSSIPLFWVASMNLVMTWSATFALGIWGSSADVGIFGIATRTALLMSFIPIAVNSIAAPKFASLYELGDFVTLEAVTRNSTTIMTILAIPVLLLFLVLPTEIMAIFGSDFAEGGIVLVILACGQFVNILTGLVRYLLMMCGRERVVGYNFVVVTILNILLCVTLIPVAGLVGAAIATAVTLAVNNLALTYHAWTRLGIWTMPFKWQPSEAKINP